MTEKSNLNWFLKIAAIAVLVLIGIYVYNQIQHQQRQEQVQQNQNFIDQGKEQIKNNITDYVKVGNEAYKYSALGGIYGLKLQVGNSTDYMLDNVKVKLDIIKANGDIYQTRYVDFNLVQPRSQMTVQVPDCDRGTSIKYVVASVKSEALGL